MTIINGNTCVEPLISYRKSACILACSFKYIFHANKQKKILVVSVQSHIRRHTRQHFIGDFGIAAFKQVIMRCASFLQSFVFVCKVLASIHVVYMSPVSSYNLVLMCFSSS